MQDTLYVGVDAHKKRSHVAVVDQGGTVLKSVDIPSSRSGVAGALGRYKRPIKASVQRGQRHKRENVVCYLLLSQQAACAGEVAAGARQVE